MHLAGVLADDATLERVLARLEQGETLLVYSEAKKKMEKARARRATDWGSRTCTVPDVLLRVAATALATTLVAVMIAVTHTVT